MVEGQVNEQDQDSKKSGYLEAQQQRVVLTFATAVFTTETGPKACFTRQSLLFTEKLDKSPGAGSSY